MQKDKTEITFLINNLHQQIEFYHQLNNLEKVKQEALMSNENQRIDSIIAQEELIIRTSKQLEADRVKWAASFAPSDVNPLEQTVRIADLLEAHPELSLLRDRLREEMIALHDLNQTNNQLINSQLAYINFSVQSIAGDIKPMYGSPGTLNKPRQESGSTRSIIDHDA